MKYKESWNSLKTHITPKWFKNAKFGIYTHWGVYSVPACGPNGTWYPYNMYHEGTPQYKYHVKNFGDPSTFGYKDFIPMFNGEKFNPDEWAELFKKAGAQFAGPVGEHHDGFTMWDSKLTEWNAAKMGPRRDVVGELEKSIRKQNMRFVVALHHAENWWFFPHWEKKYDTSDPRYSGLYGPQHNMEWAQKLPKEEDRTEFWKLQEKPSKEFLDLWLAKTKEVIDKYRPDMLWFDEGLRFIQEHYKREFLAYYYNKAEEWGKEVVVTYKRHDLPPGSGVIDLELGRFDKLTHHDWITDTTVDDGCGWSYLHDAKYKTATELVHYLVDNVSKNGLMLLNVGPKPNGEISEEAKGLLLEMGRWLEVNGEAIYDTTPWMIYGEGPTQMIKAGMFSEDQEVKYTKDDIRFTVKDDNLYAICLGWPGGEVIIKSMAEKLYKSEINSVKMLGVDEELPWAMIKEGFTIKTPVVKPCKHAYVFKIERKCPF
jgi:alpha-L-fucosidase